MYVQGTRKEGMTWFYKLHGQTVQLIAKVAQFLSYYTFDEENVPEKSLNTKVNGSGGMNVKSLSKLVTLEVQSDRNNFLVAID
jgi:hypothetical protein